MDQPLPSTPSPQPQPTAHLPKGALVAIVLLGSFLALSLMGNAFALAFSLSTSSENAEIKEELSQMTLSLQETTERAEDAERRLGSASARAEELATVGTYFKRNFQDLDEILLETDSNSVDFIDWMVENATFDDVQDAEDRYAAWSEIQDQTNEDYWALSEEVTSYITALEGGDLPEGSGT